MAETSGYYDRLVLQYEEQYAAAITESLLAEAAKATKACVPAIKDRDASCQRIVFVAGGICAPNAVAELAMSEATEKIALLKSGYVKNVTDFVGRDASGTSINFLYTADEKITGKVQTNAHTGTAVTAHPERRRVRNDDVSSGSCRHRRVHHVHRAAWGLGIAFRYVDGRQQDCRHPGHVLVPDGLVF